MVNTEELKERVPNIYEIYRKLLIKFGRKHPRWLAGYIFWRKFGRTIHWNAPKDLNEKINWLKFHSDVELWAKLADKNAVREYVQERVGKDILIEQYGVWDSVTEALKAYDNLPDDCVIKSNNGSGHILIVDRKKGGKKAYSKEYLKRVFSSWIEEKNYGVDTAEVHYQLIKNKIIAEKLLTNTKTLNYSKSVIDYKIWCFNGKPYGCLVVYDRDVEKHTFKLDFYDLKWQQCTGYMTESTLKQMIPKPKNWETMLEYASSLSYGYPQVRVDFYNIDGTIYFGEMTFTSAGGYMRYFTDKQLRKMGDLVYIDQTMKRNVYY